VGGWQMLEIIATTIEDAKRIEAAGASRIELVSALTEGGLTPSYGLIKSVVESVKIPVNVMIRPHAKSFVYTPAEREVMKEDILAVGRLKANGVVIGVLDENNQICEKVLDELLESSGDLEVTFHRAIDKMADPVQGIQVLRNYPQIKTVLTSGGQKSIVENISVIKQMIARAGHIRVMPGGGLNFNNIEQIMRATNALDYHFGTFVRDDKTPFSEINVAILRTLARSIGCFQEV
jgi:copper homeostasis protein